MNDIIGKEFGKLTVLPETKIVGKHRYFMCRCECGSLKFRRSDGIEKAKSCGCINRAGKSGKYRHGEAKTNLYKRWNDMKARCHNESNGNYHKYGAKGISVCKEWFDSYEVFRDWALENGFKEELTIDRKDFKGNYEPSNCRWITNKEQQNNTSRSLFIEVFGVKLTAKEWSEKLSINVETLYYWSKKGKDIKGNMLRKLNLKF